MITVQCIKGGVVSEIKMQEFTPEACTTIANLSGCVTVNKVVGNMFTTMTVANGVESVIFTKTTNYVASNGHRWNKESILDYCICGSGFFDSTVFEVGEIDNELFATMKLILSDALTDGACQEFAEMWEACVNESMDFDRFSSEIGDREITLVKSLLNKDERYQALKIVNM